jgi:hypothetical protein
VFRAAALEAGISSIYACAQFRFDNIEGERVGAATAEYLERCLLTPAGRSQP